MIAAHVWNPETCRPIIFVVDPDEEAKARAHAMEALMLQVNESEANWWLDDRLALTFRVDPPADDDPALD